MKTLVIITLLVLNYSGYCQNVKYDMDEVPKQTNKIIITNEFTADQIYKAVGKVLVQNGYSLKTANKDFGLFETAPKEMHRKKGWTAIFNIVVADSLITVTGQVTTGISMGFGSGVRSEVSYSQIKYMQKGIFDNSAFYEMMDLAHKLGNNFKYEIQH